jgi:hypothetical protein
MNIRIEDIQLFVLVTPVRELDQPPEETTTMVYSFHLKTRGRYRIVGTDYEVSRGACYDTTDDRAENWYLDHINDTTLDRRGPGFATREEAAEHLQRFLNDARSFSSTG